MSKSTLYTTPGGEPARTVAEWAAHYHGKTWMQIAGEMPRATYLFGLVQPEGGPVPEWRYVKLNNGRILDMRHVLVVGMKYGRLMGVLVELGQYIFDPTSANHKQDYYSNAVGEKFLAYVQKHSVHFQAPHHRDHGFKNERNISGMFSEFCISQL